VSVRSKLNRKHLRRCLKESKVSKMQEDCSMRQENAFLPAVVSQQRGTMSCPWSLVSWTQVMTTSLLRDRPAHLRQIQRSLLVYKAINGLAPSYLQDLCVPVTTVSTCATLCSAACGDLVVPRTRRRFGNRAFCVSGPTAWNSLPSDIRTASSVTTFKNLLKTHLFMQSYDITT